MAQAEVIREFLVQLGFKTDAKSFGDFKLNMEGATKGVEQLVKTISGVAMAVGAGVAAFSSKMETLYFATQKTGASAVNLKAFEKAARNFGASSEQALSSVQSLARWMRETPASEGFLESLGVKTRGANGELKDTAVLMAEIGNALRSKPYSVARQYSSVLGIDEDTFRAIMDGKFSAEMAKQAGILKESDFEKTMNDAHKFMEKLRELETRIEAIGVKIGSHIIEPVGRMGDFVVPILKTIADGWKNIYDWTQAAGKAVHDYLPDSFNDKIGEGTAWVFDKLGIRGAVDRALGIDSAPAATQPSAGKAAQQLSSIEKKYGLPAGLLDSVWSTESGRGKNMKSSAGAEGHFQFMPGTAKQYGLSNPYDFDQSADAAGRMYKDLLGRYGGSLEKAVAAYNWGPGNVDKYGLGRAPAETRGYVDKVIGGMGRGVQIAQNTTINVNGGDAAATGRAVAGEQDRVNQNLARNLQTAVN